MAVGMWAAALVSRLLVTAYVLPPVGLTNVHSKLVPVRAAVRAESLYANDGGDSEVDWDKEAAALAKPANTFYKAIKAIPVQDLVSEFADSAPPDVQQAVRFTIAKLLGNMPSEVAAITRVTSDRNIASLMFSMQMTGYMFRSAEYRRSLMESLGAAGESSGLLPPEAGEDETREEESEPPAQLPQAWPRLVRVRVRVRVTNPNRNRNSNPSPSPSPSPNPNPHPNPNPNPNQARVRAAPSSRASRAGCRGARPGWIWIRVRY